MEASRANEGLNIELPGCFNPDEDKIVFIPNAVRIVSPKAGEALR